MLDTDEKKPVLALILARLFLGMTVLVVLASGLEALIGFLMRYMRPHHKKMMQAVFS